MHLETKVIDLLNELSRKKLPQRERLLRAFMDVKNELGKIPTYLELHLYGTSGSREYRNEFGSYTGFLLWAGCLSTEEEEAFYSYVEWLRDVQRTAMAKSYKMIILLYMLERGPDRWMEPITAQEAAPFFHKFLMEKEYRKRIDFSDPELRRLWEYHEAGVSQLIAKMPMTKWGNVKGSMTSYEGGVFSLRCPQPPPQHKETVYRWKRDICLYRLHVHFERKVVRGGGDD